MSFVIMYLLFKRYNAFLNIDDITNGLLIFCSWTDVKVQLCRKSAMCDKDRVVVFKFLSMPASIVIRYEL